VLGHRFRFGRRFCLCVRSLSVASGPALAFWSGSRELGRLGAAGGSTAADDTRPAAGSGRCILGACLRRWLLCRSFTGIRSGGFGFSTFRSAEIVRVRPPGCSTQCREQRYHQQDPPSAGLWLLGLKERIEAGESSFPQRVRAGLISARLIQAQHRRSPVTIADGLRAVVLHDDGPQWPGAWAIFGARGRIGTGARRRRGSARCHTFRKQRIVFLQFGQITIVLRCLFYTNSCQTVNASVR
jgi:hypothetical protein